MVQFQDVHVAHGDFAFKRIAGAAIVQLHLRFAVVKAEQFGFRIVVWEGQIEHAVNFFFRRAVKHRRCERHTIFQVIRQFEQLGIRQTFDVFFLTGSVINLLQEFA